MVAVRSAHINKAGEFGPKKWIASPEFPASSRVSATKPRRIARQIRDIRCGSVAVWRGVEMVEILSTLSMDIIDTLRAALLKPFRADANAVSEDVLRESVGKSIVTPDSWRARYGGDPSAKRHS